MLKDLLEEKNCFKLVCGAGNEDAEEVEKLVTVYSLAGCQFFDVCAKEEIVEAAKNGLKRAGILENRYLCVSVGLSGDPHITKAEIDTKSCSGCGKCRRVCPHEAINISSTAEVINKRCIGCSKCVNACPAGAITMKTQLKDYSEVLPPIIAKGIDCIEFHAITEDETDVDEKWELLNKLYDGFLCISLDRSQLGDIRLKKRVERLVAKRKPYTTIIQADGVAMSGNDDEYSTTLQAVATAQMFQNSNIPAYIMMSGGTNTKSTELAKLCSVSPNCLAVGSYARKIIKKYLLIDNLAEDKKMLSEAVAVAKSLVDVSLRNMKND